MKFRFVFFICCIVLSGHVWGQDYVYVNTNNLIFRDRPEKKYRVLAVLQPPTRLKVDHSDMTYSNNRAVNSKFYEVSFVIRNQETKRSASYHGWVERRYTVEHLSQIAKAGIDTNISLSAAIGDLIPYMGDDAHNPNKMNYQAFPYSKYKGGEKQFAGV